MSSPAALSARLAAAAGGGALAIATALVGYYEGRSLVAYLDPVSIPTICEGFTHGVQLGDVATDAECDELTRRKLIEYLSVVDRSVPYRLPEPTRAALGSFVYNVGPGNYRSSTLLRKLRAGDIVGACRELPRWVYAKGKLLRGLVLRREKEMEICLQGSPQSQS